MSNDASKATQYARAGVNLDDAASTVDKIKPLIQKTQRAGVMSLPDAFAGVFSLAQAGFLEMGDEDIKLVASTDGVGTKLMLATTLEGYHQNIGQDCVAMCVNDVITTGAQPLLFLDYIASSTLTPDHIEQIVMGITTGCLASKCTLLGGETAQLPGLYAQNMYDVAGFCLGLLKGTSWLDPQLAKPGDHLIGLASSGIHSNGFSLVRKIIEDHNLDLTQTHGLTAPLGQQLMTPTTIYVDALNMARAHGQIISVANITGGGLIENIPRALPAQYGAVIMEDAWIEPPVFSFLTELAQISAQERRMVFNLGVGLVLVCRSSPQPIIDALQRINMDAWCIGQVTSSPGIQWHGRQK